MSARKPRLGRETSSATMTCLRVDLVSNNPGVAANTPRST